VSPNAWGVIDLRSRLAFFIVLAVAGHVSSALTFAGKTTPQRPETRPTIDRGVAFLVKDALAWKSQYKCASCHHASLVIWSLREAAGRGHRVDGAFLTEFTKWVADSGDGKTGVKRPVGVPKALNSKAVHFALGLEADTAPDVISQKGIKRLLNTVKADQTEDGSWKAWPETRPPIFGNSDESMTALATLAVLPAAAAGDPAATAARDRGVRWLANTKSDDDPQSVAIRLILWRRLGRPAEEWTLLVERIQSRQNADGGWSQAENMQSDAWATGQALYALAHAGLGPDNRMVSRAQAYLIKTQRSDGSWPMSSRPLRPGGQGATSLVPITGAGTAWAIIGLARSSDRLPR
jgi:hypothetical protein